VHWFPAHPFGGGDLAVIAALAELDFVTWGSPLRSALRYFDFNLQRSQQFGVKPWWWYAPAFAGSSARALRAGASTER
jgi:hypothetical protein